MAVKAVLRMGNPRLLKKSESVIDDEFASLPGLIEDMLDTMRAEEGVGLAAPQIGVNKRVVIFGFEQNNRYPEAEAIPYTVLVNPEIKVLDDTVTHAWEGCLSVLGMRGLVPRYEQILYRGKTLDGQDIERQASGFHARVVQHECDHLDGILYPMRITDMRYFGFEDEFIIAESSLTNSVDSVIAETA